MQSIHTRQAIVSFSINAEQVAKQWEKGAYAVSPIRNRIEMAGKLQDAGYEVRVRIDPMVPILEWEKHYKELVDRYLLPIHTRENNNRLS